jgi:thioredoxin-related protein
MKMTILLAALAVMSGIFLHGSEPRDTVDYYFSFFNPGGPKELKDFRSCFVPEEREKIKNAPKEEIRTRYPVGKVNITDVVKTGKIYEIRYRLEKRSGTGYIVLENRDGQWLINISKSSAGRKEAIDPYLNLPKLSPEEQADPVPQPLPPPPPPEPAVPSGWQPGPTPEWFVNYGPAAEKARQEKRSLFVLCTGADWCPPCKRLDKEVLRSEEFKEYAAKNLVLLYLNFPRRTPHTADQVKHNQDIRRKFGFRGGVPSYLLMDPDGQIIRRRSGYLPLPAFMEFLQPEKPQQPVSRPEPSPKREPIRSDRQAKQQAPVQNAIPATPSGWQKGPDSLWQIYYPAALALAKEKHKKILVLHTGSDWCGFCIRLRKDVLSKSEFKRFASKNLILLYLDSPQRKPLPADQQEHNQKTCRQLGFGGGVPSVMILDEDGNRIGQIRGYRPLNDFMKNLKQAAR